MLRWVLFQLHWIFGITAGLVLAVVGLTGAFLSFEDDILEWMNPGVLTVAARDDAPLLTPQQLIDAVAGAMEHAARIEEEGRAQDAYRREIANLSPKEREILDDLSAGLQIKEIASKHALSASTVRVHRRNIRSKVQVGGLGKLLALHNRYGAQA